MTDTNRSPLVTADPSVEISPGRCEVCNGEGAVEKPEPQRDDPHYASAVPCGTCNGNGWI